MIVALLLSAVVADHYFSPDDGALHLRMNKDGSFKILQVTDLHLGEDEGKDRVTL